MSLIIDSPSNPLIKDAAALQQKKERQSRGQWLVETRHPIEEALRAGLRLVHYFQQEGVEAPAALPPESDIHVLSERAMARLSSTNSAPPCVAVFEASPAAHWEATTASQANFFALILDQLQDPGNLGTLIRSAVAFGVSHLILTDGSTDLFSPKIIRSSAGVVFRLPHISLSDILQAEGGSLNLYFATAHALHGREPVPYRAVAYASPAALVLGNEGRGISDETTDLLSRVGTLMPITIPMPGAVESLNVAVSGSIILAEAAGKRAEGLA